ncbi:MAG: hypothetical protein GX568_01315 [Candidatus Gastranaerophilales bacterium]|nr:hypothetical protein [Candidatus Gastranaerophilales bacterium]
MNKVLADKAKQPDFVEILLNIIKQIGVFLYEFIFVWEDDEPYEKEGFIDNEKLKQVSVLGQRSISPVEAMQNNATVAIYNRPTEYNNSNYEQVAILFGEAAAEYINNLRNDVDNLVEEQGLTQLTSIRIVIPPEKIQSSLLGREFFEINIKRISDQFDGKVVLKPGEIRIKHTLSGVSFAEMQLEAYAVSEKTIEQAQY